MIEALDIARQKGLCRFTGFSTHDRPWAKKLIETYPDVMQVLCTPYTAKSKELPTDSLFDAVRKHDIGMLGIKPFASNAIFQGDGSPDGPHVEEDDRRARLAIRYILGNPAITAPIPGLISLQQVDNMVAAVRERRELDAAERAELERIGDEMWARLPAQLPVAEGVGVRLMQRSQTAPTGQPGRSDSDSEDRRSPGVASCGRGPRWLRPRPPASLVGSSLCQFVRGYGHRDFAVADGRGQVGRPTRRQQSPAAERPSRRTTATATSAT